MAVTINASTTAGLVQTADLTGSLVLQTANTTALTINTSQNATFAGTVAATSYTGDGSALTGVGGMTLLGTITASGTGNQFSLGSLTLTSYRYLYLIYSNLTPGTTGASQNMSISNATGDQSASNSLSGGAVSVQYWWSGSSIIDLTSGLISYFNMQRASALPTLPIPLGTSIAVANSTNGATTIGTATTTIYLYMVGVGTKAGSVTIYGVK